ncbi:hypothetical protein GGQ85_002399 [Nitrobacter vulgaris]|uniref:hypothetical protein n=1 Tax=Nitrobacter vulgaris TaxID=29421 RepID=UPI00286659D3|nr:hypothetical protein [Nitrobacter vulgaris]MDR6304687.1 hypothetical protein [Nitrobacter vulgaris]
MVKPYYADFDGLPSISNGREAWVYAEGRGWYEINAASHGMNSWPVTKAEFDKMFPGTPELPPEAFTEKPHQAEDQKKPYYADFGGLPSRFVKGEAWAYTESAGWYEINSTSHGANSYPITKEAFDECFPNTPPLPPEAFQEKPHPVEDQKILESLPPDEREPVESPMKENPGLTAEERELVQRLMKDYPGLTAERALEGLRAAGM